MELFVRWEAPAFRLKNASVQRTVNFFLYLAYRESGGHFHEYDFEFLPTEWYEYFIQYITTNPKTETRSTEIPYLFLLTNCNPWDLFRYFHQHMAPWFRISTRNINLSHLWNKETAESQKTRLHVPCCCWALQNCMPVFCKMDRLSRTLCYLQIPRFLDKQSPFPLKSTLAV